MPPCGSPLITTMKSVPLPVSWLSASSETISDGARRHHLGDAVDGLLRDGDAVERRLGGIHVRRDGLGVAIDPSAPAGVAIASPSDRRAAGLGLARRAWLLVMETALQRTSAPSLT